MINMVALMGRLTYEPELKSTPNGLSVIRFQVAVDRTYQAKGQERQADFIDCVAWRSTGEFVSKYFAKGRMAVVSGRLQIRSWTDKDGNKRRSAEVVADNVYFGESKREDGNASYGGNAYNTGSNSFTPPPAPGYGGYSAPAPTYSAPSQSAADFAMLDDNDAQLPF